MYVFMSDMTGSRQPSYANLFHNNPNNPNNPPNNNPLNPSNHTNPSDSIIYSPLQTMQQPLSPPIPSLNILSNNPNQQRGEHNSSRHQNNKSRLSTAGSRLSILSTKTSKSVQKVLNISEIPPSSPLPSVLNNSKNSGKKNNNNNKNKNFENGGKNISNSNR